MGFSEEDLEAEFDPNSHDATMKRIFDSHHYQEENEEEKPIFSDSEEGIDISYYLVHIHNLFKHQSIQSVHSFHLFVHSFH